MHPNYQSLHRDGLGDDGERLRTVATALAELGWSDSNIKQRVMTDPACVHPAWDDSWVQQEIEACISKVRPLGPKPVPAVVKVEQRSGDGLPGWLRARIESLTVPVDRDQYFRETVAALSDHGWDSTKIAIAIAARPWLPARYAGRHLQQWGIEPLIAARPSVPLRNRGEAAPEGVRPPAAVFDATAASSESKDAIAAWIDDRCERDASWESSAALFASWTTWAEGAGENAGSQRRFAQTLESRGFQSQRMRHGRGFLGLRIIPTRDPP
jgi:hypothetical protein